MTYRTKVDYRSIAEKYYGISAEGKHVHHIDGDCHNNNPENLVICTAEEHAEFHKEMGHDVIASLLNGQLKDKNWHSIIGVLGGKATKGIVGYEYTVTKAAKKQREYARSCKKDPSTTKVSLKGRNRTNKQKLGNKKSIDTRSNRKPTELEKQQFDSFSKKGIEATRLSMIGSKKLINVLTGEIKFAKPYSDKWFSLINNNFTNTKE